MPEVIMPKMGDAAEGILLKWKKKDGETVQLGDVIVEIETDKCYVEIEAQNAGVLYVKAEVGAILSVGTVIAVIDDVAVHKPYYATSSMTKKRSWLSQIKRK